MHKTREYRARPPRMAFRRTFRRPCGTAQARHLAKRGVFPCNLFGLRGCEEPALPAWLSAFSLGMPSNAGETCNKRSTSSKRRLCHAMHIAAPKAHLAIFALKVQGRWWANPFIWCSTNCLNQKATTCGELRRDSILRGGPKVQHCPPSLRPHVEPPLARPWIWLRARSSKTMHHRFLGVGLAMVLS